MRQKAFSLVELLIAIVLLSLLITTAMFAFRYFIDNLERSELKLPKVAIAYELLSNSIEGTYYYVYDNKDPFGNIEYEYYNFTDETSYRYITTHPIYNNKISVSSISCDNSKLIYREKLLYSEDNDFFTPNINKEDIKISLLDDLKECRIKYEFAKSNDPIPSFVAIEFRKRDKNYRWLFNIFSNFNKHIIHLQTKERDI